MTSCKHKDWNFTHNSDKHSHNIIFQNSSSQLDILMNREMTDMTMPIISKNAAERYLGHNDLQSVMYYNIYNSLALLQVENYAEAYEYIFKTQQHYHKLHKDQTAGLFWYGKYLISQYVQNYQDAVNQVLEAAEHFRQPEVISFDYSNFLLEAIRNYVIIGDYEKAIAMMTIFEPNIYEAPSRIKYKYYDTWLNIYKHTDPSKINEILGIILSEIPPYDIYWLNIAYSFYLTGEYNHASEALDNYRLYNSQFGTSTAYWGVSAHIMEGFGKDSEALNYFKKYLTEIESEYHRNISSSYQADIFDIINGGYDYIYEAYYGRYKEKGLELANRLLEEIDFFRQLITYRDYSYNKPEINVKKLTQESNKTEEKHE